MILIDPVVNQLWHQALNYPGHVALRAGNMCAARHWQVCVRDLYFIHFNHTVKKTLLTNLSLQSIILSPIHCCQLKKANPQPHFLSSDRQFSTAPFATSMCESALDFWSSCHDNSRGAVIWWIRGKKQKTGEKPQREKCVLNSLNSYHSCGVPDGAVHCTIT